MTIQETITIMTITINLYFHKEIKVSGPLPSVHMRFVEVHMLSA